MRHNVVHIPHRFLLAAICFVLAAICLAATKSGDVRSIASIQNYNGKKALTRNSSKYLE